MTKRFFDILLSPFTLFFETSVEMIYYLFTGKHKECDEIMSKWLLK